MLSFSAQTHKKITRNKCFYKNLIKKWKSYDILGFVYILWNTGDVYKKKTFKMAAPNDQLSWKYCAISVRWLSRGTFRMETDIYCNFQDLQRRFHADQRPNVH